MTAKPQKEFLKMRPTSPYLYSMIHETPPCRLNLSGSTPPFPAGVEFFADLRPALAREDIDALNTQLKRWLASRTAGRPEQFQFAPGSSSVYTQALAAISEYGERVLIESPTYDPFSTCAQFLGLKVEFFNRTFDRDRDLAVMNKASRRCRVLVLSNPNCPTGRMSSREDLIAFARLFKWVIIDEVFLPLFAEGALTLLPGDLPKNILLIGSLSKSTGLSMSRFGWLRADQKIAMAFEKIGYNFHIEMPSFSLSAAELAFRRWDDLISKNLQALEKPRATLRQFAEQMSRPGSKEPLFSHNLQAGHYATFKIPKTFKSGDEFAKAVNEKYGVWLRPTKLFRLPKHVRINFFMSDDDALQLAGQLAEYY